MKRIRIIENNQGSGMSKVQDGVWEKLLQLDNGYFEKKSDEYDFYTNDGLLIKAKKNSDDSMAKHFGAKGNLLFVDYCEPGLGISLIEEITSTSNQFIFRSTRYYEPFGGSFFIKFAVTEEDEQINIPNIWSFQSTYNKTDIKKLRFYLFNSIFEPPQVGELLFKNIDETDEIVLNYKGKYFRKLCTQMADTLKDRNYEGDRNFQSIYFSLKSAKLVKEHTNFIDFN